MTFIPFTKFHGFGNDYIVIEHGCVANPTALPELAIAMCHRNTGVGGDGIAGSALTLQAQNESDCFPVSPGRAPGQ